MSIGASIENITAREIQKQIDAFELAGKAITVIPAGVSADSLPPSALEKRRLANIAKASRAVGDMRIRLRKKPITTAWADTAEQLRAAQARGGKAGAAAQRGTKKQGLKKHSEVTA